MKKFKIATTIGITLLITGAQLFAQNNVKKDYYKLTSQEMFKAPISPLLYGNFIELGWGVEVEPMINEMLFNRSFERFMPYRVPAIMWFDLYYDENDISKGFEKDWSKFDWYHSGYEHNSWFAAPGTPPSPSLIEEKSTFIQPNTPLHKLELIPTQEGAVHGNQCLLVKNTDDTNWLAVAQEGKFLRKGEKYAFNGMLKSVSGLSEAEIRFYPQGKWDAPIAVIPIKNISSKFSEFEVSFQNTQYDGYATFSLWIPPKSSLMLDDLSLKFSTNYYGWRTDVIDLIKKIGPKVIRFPGGCFASFYDWKEGIGPRHERVPSGSYFWGGQNNNDVGVAEYAMLCKAVGAEMSFCVNVYHPSKRTYETDFPNEQVAHGFNLNKFISITEGAKSAADLVAYCNLPQGKHPMADLRVAHGFKEPFGIKFFEMDNEPMRWYNAEDYAWAVVAYSKAMKAVDPSVKIGLTTYGDRIGWTAVESPMAYYNKVDQMLEIAGPYIDFLADRGDADTKTRHSIERMKVYNNNHSTHIKYCDTEWLAFAADQSRDSFNKAVRSGKATNSYKFSKWLYGLNLMKNFLAFQRMGDDMLFVNFNNMANSHSQSSLESPKEGAYLTASGRGLELLSSSPIAWLLKFEKYQAQASDEFQVQAGWNQQRNKLVILVCNRTIDKRIASIDLSGIQSKFHGATITRLSGDPLAMNTLKNPNAIRKESFQNKSSHNTETVKTEAPPYSFTEIVLE